MSANSNRIQITVTSWNKEAIKGATGNGSGVTVALPDACCYSTLTQLLYKGCKLNLLYVVTDDNGILHPRDIILDPDYLLDISALARCLQPYGSPAIGYILNLIEPTTDSAARLLGEAANMFLDDCVNERSGSRASYKGSMEKFFREYPLQLSACDGIDRKFFDAACEQFCNIQKTVGTQAIEGEGGYTQDDAQLEPSFFCEALGLQGRIDLLQGNRLIELKSGKADEFHNSSKDEHKLQMSLYKEMLCHCMGIARDSIKAHLFYSRYPRTYSDECTPAQISSALMLRNHIVTLMQQMGKDGLRDTLQRLSPEELNERGDRGRLWNDFLRPRIEKILLPIKEADELLLQYVFGNIAFVAREMLIAKVGSSDATVQRKTAQSGRCFSDVWNAPTETKIENGNILTGLSIKEFTEADGISDIIFEVPQQGCDFFPNFRAGDTVFVYRRNSDGDKAVNRQVTRGSLTSITPGQLTIHLRHKQRNRTIFPTEERYAIEHDHLDSTFRSSLRDLYSLLTAPQERIDLLLSRRQPQFDKERTLSGNYGNDYINDIVLKAKQADDLFLLVGPPGTGKTSQALSSMVREFMLDGECNILLASYTNRAVDEICHTLENLPEKPYYIRIGSEQTCAEPHRQYLMKNVIADCRNREQIRATMQQTRIFVGTIASLTARKELFQLKKFHTAIIDEATQILESQMAGLMAAQSPDGTAAIKKFILIGDPKQLPAVVAQPAKDCAVKSSLLQEIGIREYSASLFERLYYRYQQRPTEGLVATLYKQGRMHPIVGEFANRHFYGSTLIPIPLPHQCEENIYNVINNGAPCQQIIATRRTAFIATDTPQGNDIAKVNRPEAEKIAQFVKAYYELETANGKECNPSEEVGIIVPFRNQIAMVAHAIAKLNIPCSSGIVIDTVERFQGSQREMILFGTTVWQREQMEILSSPITDAEGCVIDRKLNVALTRARRRMYIFGNRETLSSSPLYKALMDELG